VGSYLNLKYPYTLLYRAVDGELVKYGIQNCPSDINQMQIFLERETQFCNEVCTQEVMRTYSDESTKAIAGLNAECHSICKQNYGSKIKLLSLLRQ